LGYYQSVELGAGDHEYFFYVTYEKDQENKTVRLPVSGNLSYHIVGGKNPPQLFDEGIPTDNPRAFAMIDFGVMYKDLDGDEPTDLVIFIQHESWDFNESFELNVSGTDYFTGVCVSIDLMFELEGNWSYWYRVTSGDYYGSDTSELTNRYPRNDEFSVYIGPLINKQLYEFKSIPSEPIVNEPVNMTIKFHHSDDIAPKWATFSVENTDYPDWGGRTINYTVNVSGDTYDIGVDCFIIITFPATGEWEYIFQIGDYANFAWYKKGTILVNEGSEVTNPPELFNSLVTPAEIDVNEIATLSISYRDLDNDPPNEFIVEFQYDGSGDEISLIKPIDVYNNSYSSGITESINYKFENSGNWSYRFYVSSVDGEAYYPESGYFTINVKENTQPPADSDSESPGIQKKLMEPQNLVSLLIAIAVLITIIIVLLITIRRRRRGQEKTMHNNELMENIKEEYYYDNSEDPSDSELRHSLKQRYRNGDISKQTYESAMKIIENGEEIEKY